MTLRDLESALPALSEFRSAAPRGIDWGLIESELGLRLPSDFIELSEHYSLLVLGEFLSVHIPDPGKEQEFLSVAREFLSDLDSLREADMSHGYAPHPAEAGLFPWADSCEGDTWFWKTGGPGSDPAAWSIVVSGHNDDWVEVRETLTGYLTGLVRGVIPPDALPPDFPGPSPTVEG